MGQLLPNGGVGYNAHLDYQSSPVLWDFLLCDNFVSGILGPLGSGKSVGCCAKIMRKACDQKPDRDNIRRTRWLAVRNTYVELRATTIKTWLEVFPEANCGPIRYSHPITHHIKIPAHGRKQPGLDCEVIFMALDKPQDIKKLKSLDLTGAWVNEACEVPIDIIDMLTGRVGRFPSAVDIPATWAGIMLDTNATDDQNWYFKASESDETPPLDLDPELFGGLDIDLAWRFFRQPPAVLELEEDGNRYRVKEAGYPGAEVPPNHVIPSAGKFWCMNPKAENIANLRPGYYIQQISKKRLEWIQRFLQAKYVYFVEGKPWVPEYSDSVMSRDLKWNKGLPLIGGIDCGSGTLSPAAAIGQRGTYGDWRVLKELSLFDIGIDRFSVALHAMLSRDFGTAPMKPRFWLDPAAKTKDEVYEIAVEDHLRTRNFDVQLAPTNDPDSIREAFSAACTRMFNIEGNIFPGFLVDRSCTMLRAGLAGKWYRKQIQTKAERYTERPEKNDWSHVCDGAGLMLVGGGELHTFKHGRHPAAAAAQVNASIEFARSAQTGGTVMASEFDPFK